MHDLRRSAFIILTLIIVAVAAALVGPARLTAQMRADCPMCPMMHHGTASPPQQAPAAPSDSASPNAQARAEAAEVWGSRCAACHGSDGRGDGPGAASLKPKPVNFHSRDWQKRVTDDQIAKAIVGGGSAVGLSTQMAANPDLEDEPEVVKALVARVRALGK